MHRLTTFARIVRWTAWVALVASPALAQADGALRWAFTTLGVVQSSPALGADGTIYFGSQDKYVYAVSANGSLKWRFLTGDWVDSTPAVGPDGTIYVGSWDGKLYALRDDGARATKLWEYAAGSYIASSPALATDGTIYVGSGDFQLHAVNPDGSRKWTALTSDWIDSAPAIGPDGTVYVGSWDNSVYAIAPDGRIRWSFATGGDVVGSPAIGTEGTIYIGSRDRKLYALAPTGRKLWEFATGDVIDGSAVLAPDGTIYFGSADSRIYALNRDGTKRWDYALQQPAFSTPAVRADGTIVVGTSDGAIVALTSDGTLKWRTAVGDWLDASPLVAPDGNIYVGCYDRKLYALAGNGQPLAAGSAWPAFRRNAARAGRSALLEVDVPPASQFVAVGGSATLSVSAFATESGPALAYQWRLNGSLVAGATSPTLALANFQPADAGAYTVTITNSAASIVTAPAIVAVAPTAKVLGAAQEIDSDIRHPNGNIYDQVLLGGVAATVTADPGQVTRISYIDLSDDIVQVEFSGAGALTLALEASSGPAAPVNYNQPGIVYMKGHARIVIAGADETTNVSVFSVGRGNAVNQALFRDGVTYDGFADIASISILSANGRFGGVFTGNADYFATRGLAGIHAPGVSFTNRIVVGDINAADAATPVFLLGAAASDTLVAGGDFLQLNGAPVEVSGLVELKFVAGATSHGGILPAQTNQARLEENGRDVTAQIVANPTP